MMKREHLKSELFRAVILIILYLLQGALFSRLRILGAMPLPLVLFAVGVGLFFGGLSGGCWGLAAGLLCDHTLGGTALTFTLYLTALGFFTGFLGEFIMAKGFPSFFVLSLCSLLVAAFLQSFAHLFFFGSPPLYVIRTGLIQTLYSSIFIIPVYIAVRKTRTKV